MRSAWLRRNSLRRPSDFPVAEFSDLKRLIPYRRGPGCRATGPVLPRRRNRTHACVAIGNPAEAVMAGFLFLVSATTPGIFKYLKLTSKSEEGVPLHPPQRDRCPNP